MLLVKQYDDIVALQSKHAVVEGAYQQACTEYQSEVDKEKALHDELVEFEKVDVYNFKGQNEKMRVIMASQKHIQKKGEERRVLHAQIAAIRDELEADTASFRQMLEKCDKNAAREEKKGKNAAREEEKGKKQASRALRQSKKSRPSLRVVPWSTKKGSGEQGHRACSNLFSRSLGGEPTFAHKNGITSMDDLHKRIANEHYNIQVKAKYKKNCKGPTKDEHTLWTKKGQWSGHKFVELLNAWCNSLHNCEVRQATLDNFLEEFDQVRTRKCNGSDSVQHLIAKYLNPSVFPHDCKVPTVGDKYKVYKSYQPHTTVMNKVLTIYVADSPQDQEDEEGEADEEDEEKAPPLDEGAAAASSESWSADDSQASSDESDFESVAPPDSLPGKRKRETRKSFTTEEGCSPGKVMRYKDAKARGVRLGAISYRSNPREVEEDRDASS